MIRSVLVVVLAHQHAARVPAKAGQPRQIERARIFHRLDQLPPPRIKQSPVTVARDVIAPRRDLAVNIDQKLFGTDVAGDDLPRRAPVEIDGENYPHASKPDLS